MKKIFAKAMVFALAVVMALSLTACGVDITSVGLPESMQLEKGETTQLTVDFGAQDGATEEAIAKAAEKLTLVWSSSDEAVATVDETGKVTAVGAGTAEITVALEDGNISSTCEVKVVVPAEGVTAPETLNLEVNGENTAQLDVKATPEDATDVTFTYESSNPEVATVDENGVVTAVANGEADITVTMTQKLESDKNATPVAESEPAESATAESVSESEAASVASEATSEPESVPASDSSSSSSEVEDAEDEAPVVDEDAIVMTATTHVVVTTKVESLAFDKGEGTLTTGNSTSMKVTVLPESAGDQTITWKSSDESVATVDADGKVKAVKAGTATITASIGDVSAEYALTVRDVTCSYCGKTGHTSSSCPTKAADEKAAAQAAQAAQNTGGGTAAPGAPSNPDPAPNPQPGGGGSSGGNFGEQIPGLGDNQVVTGGGNGDGSGEVPDL
ncbi:Ig-like domain-containing protein [Candidatus Allofournierella merdipullorum]|uniref:Ig-like domain-containing protein n=1 Tax=Candidatus Allofournierella merdipullorum TaxID=2838595 RepID=UPI00374F32AC